MVFLDSESNSKQRLRIFLDGDSIQQLDREQSLGNDLLR